jgi:hypothetical protein
VAFDPEFRETLRESAGSFCLPPVSGRLVKNPPAAAGNRSGMNGLTRPPQAVADCKCDRDRVRQAILQIAAIAAVHQRQDSDGLELPKTGSVERPLLVFRPTGETTDAPDGKRRHGRWEAVG